MKTISPLQTPVLIIASTMYLYNFFTINLVPLHNRGGSIFRSKITVAPNFNDNLCRGNPGGFNEFKNSGA